MLRDRPDAEELARGALAVATGVEDRFAIVNADINLMTVGALHGTAPNTAGMLELIA